MKKFWKSAATLLMGAAFAFTGAACGDNPAGSVPHSDSTPPTSTGGGEDNKAELSRSYIAGAMEQLSSAQSLRATFAIDVDVSDSAPSPYTLQEKATGEIVVSQSDTGINAKISLTNKGKISQSGQEETLDETWELYILDGFMYEYDPVGGYYEISRFDLNLPFPGGLTEAIKAAPVSFPLSETPAGQMDSIVEILASLLEEKGTVEETSASLALSYDLKKELNAGIAFINDLNSAANLEEAIDLVLAKLSPGLTVNALLDIVKPLGVQNLEQLISFLDIYLAPQGVSLNEIKNTLLDMEEVQSFLYMIFASDIMAGTLSENFIEEWKTKSINEILNDLNIGEITINEILGQLIGGASMPDPGTGAAEPFDLAKFIDEVIKPYLRENTLEDLGISLPALDGIEVKSANTDMSVAFGGDKKITGAAFGFDLGATHEQESEGASYVQTIAIGASFKIEEIGASQANIALPADAVCVYAIWNEGLTADLGLTDDWADIYFMRLNGSVDPEKVEYVYEGMLTVYNADGGDYVEYEFTYLPPSSLAADSLTITIVFGESGNMSTGETQVFDEARLKALFGDSLTAEIPVFLELGFVDLTEFPGYVGGNA